MDSNESQARIQDSNGRQARIRIDLTYRPGQREDHLLYSAGLPLIKIQNYSFL